MVYVAPIRFEPPQEMPGGWWDALHGLGEWVKEQLRRAYESGYMAGKLDTLRACKEREESANNGVDTFLRGIHRRPS